MSATPTVLELTHNPTFVYYLYLADNTSQQLVSSIFDRIGYYDWKRMMAISLSSKNKTSFVDGSLPKPTDPKEATTWEHANNMICGWILKPLGPMIVKSVLHLPSARAIWLDLEERFSHSSVAQLYSL